MKEETQLKIWSGVAGVLIVLGVLQYLAGVWILNSWQATTGAVVMMFCGIVLATNIRLHKIERKMKTRRK